MAPEEATAAGKQRIERIHIRNERTHGQLSRIGWASRKRLSPAGRMASELAALALPRHRRTARHRGAASRLRRQPGDHATSRARPIDRRRPVSPHDSHRLGCQRAVWATLPAVLIVTMIGAALAVIRRRTGFLITQLSSRHRRRARSKPKRPDGRCERENGGQSWPSRPLSLGFASDAVLTLSCLRSEVRSARRRARGHGRRVDVGWSDLPQRQAARPARSRGAPATTGADSTTSSGETRRTD